LRGGFIILGKRFGRFFEMNWPNRSLIQRGSGNWLRLGAFHDRIREIVRDDEGQPKKQRHTPMRIFERLWDEEENAIIGGCFLPLRSYKVFRYIGPVYRSRWRAQADGSHEVSQMSDYFV